MTESYQHHPILSLLRERRWQVRCAPITFPLFYLWMLKPFDAAADTNRLHIYLVEFRCENVCKSTIGKVTNFSKQIKANKHLFVCFLVKSVSIYAKNLLLKCSEWTHYEKSLSCIHEVLRWEDILLDKMNNISVPTYYVLSESEIKQMEKRRKLKRENLKKMIAARDPIAVYMGYRHGTVLATEQAGIDYRYVI